MDKKELFRSFIKTGTFKLPDGTDMPIHGINMQDFTKIIGIWNDDGGQLKANAMFVVSGSPWFDSNSKEDLETVMSMPYELVIKIADAINDLSGLQEDTAERKKKLKAIQP